MNQDSQPADLGPLNARTALRVLVAAPDSYGLVLALLIVSFILAPFAQGSQWLLARVLIQGATVLFALHTSRVYRRTMRIAMLIVGLSLALAFIAFLVGDSKQTQGQIEALLALLFALSVPAMLRRILTARDVGVEVVIGATDVYIILGLFFSAVYAAIGDLSSTPFFTEPQQVNAGSYQFFSFVTLTTVGYGNLVPAAQVGQSLAVMEALFGQIYLVTLVGRLVSGLQPGSRHRALDRLVAEREEHEKLAAANSNSAPSAPFAQAPGGPSPQPTAPTGGLDGPAAHGPPPDTS